MDLGDSFDAIRVYVGWYHTCAVSNLGESKCFGRNNNGQLGIGSTAQRGDGGNEMGNNLVAIDWGTDFEVEQMCLGFYHTCALSTNAEMKCIGNNGYGQLGYGYTTNLGDSTSELGDALPVIDLGDDFDTVQIQCGSYFTCARSSNGEMKCWGEAENGQLGQGDTFRRGDESGEMGNSLPAINLGSGFEAATMTAGTDFVCALSTSGDIKCFGENGNGQLGYGDTSDRGKTPNTIGENVPTVDLGTDFVVKDVAAGHLFTCATSNNATMKCWVRTESPSPSLTVHNMYTLSLSLSLRLMSVYPLNCARCALSPWNRATMGTASWGRRARLSAATAPTKWAITSMRSSSVRGSLPRG